MLLLLLLLLLLLRPLLIAGCVFGGQLERVFVLRWDGCFLQPYFMVSHYCRASKIVGVSVEFVSAFGGRKEMAIFFVDNMFQVRPRNGNKNVGLTWYIHSPGVSHCSILPWGSIFFSFRLNFLHGWFCVLNAKWCQKFLKLKQKNGGHVPPIDLASWHS